MINDSICLRDPPVHPLLGLASLGQLSYLPRVLLMLCYFVFFDFYDVPFLCLSVCVLGTHIVKTFPSDKTAGHQHMYMIWFEHTFVHKCELRIANCDQILRFYETWICAAHFDDPMYVHVLPLQMLYCYYNYYNKCNCGTTTTIICVYMFLGLMLVMHMWMCSI